MELPADAGLSAEGGNQEVGSERVARKHGTRALGRSGRSIVGKIVLLIVAGLLFLLLLLLLLLLFQTRPDLDLNLQP
jgi:hypothetical protein